MSLCAVAVGVPGPLAAAAEAPPQVSEVRAFHRAGQTFVTWKEVEPLIAAGKATWGEVRRAMEKARRPLTYRICAHDEPITAANVAKAELLGEAGPLSAYNVNARNKEYLIARAMVQVDEIGELARDYNGYMHKWTPDHPRMDRYPVRRFVIDEEAGELAAGTGLYVHHPKRAGRRYYAVLACRSGAANTKDLSPANAPAGPVSEAVGPGEPVRQGKGLEGPYFDWPGTRWVYVQWCAPPLAPRQNMYFNWSVLIPPDIQGKVPAELYFHPVGYSYAQPGRKMLLGSIQIAPHDWPPSGWYGYHTSYPDVRSAGGRKVVNHTQQRIAAFLRWAIGALAIDPDRVLAVGGDGAAAMAIRRPELFAYVLITRFDAAVLEPKLAGELTAAWGPKGKDITDEAGRGEWRWAMLDELVSSQAAKDLPLFVCRGASWGRDKGWGKGRGRLYRALHAARQPLVAHWAWGGKLPRPNKHDGLWRGLDITRRSPVPALANSSLDQEGEGRGQTNMSYSWKDVQDTPDHFDITLVNRQESTFDLTPRRLRKFRPEPGEKLRWRAVSLPGRHRQKPAPQSGEVQADADGLVTLKGLKYARDAAGLVVRISRGQ